MTLIERIQALTCPDREVDVGIHNEVFGTKYVRTPHSVSGFFTSKDDNGCPYVPAYTASLDATFALTERVLPDWRIENLCEWDAEILRKRGSWMCDLVPRGKDFSAGMSVKCPHAPSPAIALLIATLTAKEAKNE